MKHYYRLETLKKNSPGKLAQNTRNKAEIEIFYIPPRKKLENLLHKILDTDQWALPGITWVPDALPLIEYL